MAASILNSARAVDVSFFIVRAFVALRRIISEHKELARKITQLERKLADHDDQIIAIIQAIKELSGPQPRCLRNGALVFIRSNPNESLNLTGKIMPFYVKAYAGSKPIRPAG